jgi:hypothetical protein
MPVLETKLFGRVEIAGDAYVKRETTVGARTLTRSLYVGELDQPALDRAATLVDTADALDARAREAIIAHDGDVVKDFIAFHNEELDLGLSTPDLHARLDLVGVNIHPRDPDGFSVVFDYSIDRAQSDQLLAVRFDTRGTVAAVSHES